ADASIRGGELVERPARDLDDAIIQSRLEAGERLAGDGVRNLIQAQADCYFGGDASDRIAGRLRGQRRGPTHARVHLDHEILEAAWVERELHVTAALDPQSANDVQRGGAEELVLL